METPHDMLGQENPPPKPKSLDLDKDKSLTICWSDGRVSIYPIAYLRRMSPSADSRQLREAIESNPLTVLPASAGAGSGPLRAESAELVGHYALRIRFSDGHDAGIFSWAYLRRIDPNAGDYRGSTNSDGPGIEGN